MARAKTIKGVRAPTLKQLESKQCSLEELQAAFLKLVGMYNKLVVDFNHMKTSGRIRSKQEAEEAIWNRPFTI